MGNQSQNNYASCCYLKVGIVWIPSSTSWLCSLDSWSPPSCPCPSLCHGQYKQPQSWLLSVIAREKSFPFCKASCSRTRRIKQSLPLPFVLSIPWQPRTDQAVACCLCASVWICVCVNFFLVFLENGKGWQLVLVSKRSCILLQHARAFCQDMWAPYLPALWITWNTWLMDNTCQHISLDSSRGKKPQFK